MADLTITATSVVSISGTKVTSTAGEALTAGQPVYIKTSDSKLYKAQADGTAEVANAAGITLHAASANQPIRYQTDGSLAIAATTVKGVMYAVSEAAGGICPPEDVDTTGDFVTFLGWATNTSGTFVLDIKATGSQID